MGLFYINLDSTAPNRFDPEFFFEYTDNLDLLNSEFLRQLKELPENGTYTVSTEEGRPDLLSYKIYTDTQYWWLLLIYNDLVYVDDLVLGMTIKFPSLADLEAIYFSLTSKQAAT